MVLCAYSTHTSWSDQGAGLPVHQALEGGLQILIDPLGLSIGLGVEVGR